MKRLLTSVVAATLMFATPALAGNDGCPSTFFYGYNVEGWPHDGNNHLLVKNKAGKMWIQRGVEGSQDRSNHVAVLLDRQDYQEQKILVIGPARNLGNGIWLIVERGHYIPSREVVNGNYRCSGTSSNDVTINVIKQDEWYKPYRLKSSAPIS